MMLPMQFSKKSPIGLTLLLASAIAAGIVVLTVVFDPTTVAPAHERLRTHLSTAVDDDNETADDSRSHARTPAAPPPGTSQESTELRDQLLVSEEGDPSLPPDPTQRGGCVLTMTLCDEQGGIVDSGLDVWRLGAPGNEHWTDGDQLQTTTWTRDGVAVVEHLPAGDYRVVVHEQRWSAEDPPAFVVTGTGTRVHFCVATPETYTASVTLFDETGDALRLARCETSRRLYDRDRSPAWLSRRRTKVVQRFSMPDKLPVSVPGRRVTELRPLANEPGLVLGLHREGSKSSLN